MSKLATELKEIYSSFYTMDMVSTGRMELALADFVKRNYDDIIEALKAYKLIEDK